MPNPSPQLHEVMEPVWDAKVWPELRPKSESHYSGGPSHNLYWTGKSWIWNFGNSHLEDHRWQFAVNPEGNCIASMVEGLAKLGHWPYIQEGETGWSVTTFKATHHQDYFPTLVEALAAACIAVKAAVEEAIDDSISKGEV